MPRKRKVTAAAEPAAEWVDTPIYDELIRERGGREPHQFEGHEEWDDSEEAAAAYQRGVAEAQATEPPWERTPDGWGPDKQVGTTVRVNGLPEGDRWEFKI